MKTEVLQSKAAARFSAGEKANGLLYPETMLAAMPSKEQVTQVQRQLEEAGVKYLFSCWIDILGVPKTKPVPVSELSVLCAGKGPQFAVHSVTPFPELGPSDPDQIAIPDLSSVVICPWDRTVAWVFADLFLRDKPYNVCPRMALKRQVQLAAQSGYAFYAGFEPEFMVMRYDAEGRARKAFDSDPQLGLRPRRQAFGYDAEFSLDAMPFLGEVTKMMEGLGWNMKNVVCEGAYSQFELDFDYADVVAMADRFTFLRVMLKEVAKKNGLFVTYMPKPTQGDWRNGAHINFSAQRIGRAGNAFEAEDGGWSEVAMNALAGVITHGAALTAVACSTVNSYKGLLGRAKGLEGGTLTWAPTHICYGRNNRSAMLRLPQARRAIEDRAADMCQNPYLSLAIVMAASLEGIQQKSSPGQPIERSLYDVTDEELAEMRIQPLPGTLIDAVRAFDADTLAKETLGPTMHTLFSRHKHAEWGRYHEHVSEWEQKEYMRFF